MPTFGSQVNDVQAAARAVVQRLHILRASNDGEIEGAFATAAELRADALLVAADPFMYAQKKSLGIRSTRAGFGSAL
jgi:putative ABC transport system substrate-binding protein